MASTSSYFRTTLKTALAVSGLALVLALPASAALRMNTTGGTSCKGSSGFGATVFYFSNQSAENTSGAGQYLTCEIPTVHTASATTPISVQVLISNNVDTPGEATCALQSGYEYGGDTSGVTTAIYTIPLAANSYGVMTASDESVPVIPGSSSQYDPYTLTCLIPAGAELGTITIALPNSLVIDL